MNGIIGRIMILLGIPTFALWMVLALNKISAIEDAHDGLTEYDATWLWIMFLIGTGLTVGGLLLIHLHLKWFKSFKNWIVEGHWR